MRLLPTCHLHSDVPGHLKPSHSKTEFLTSPAPHSSASGVPSISTSQTSTGHPKWPPPSVLSASKCSPSYHQKTLQIPPLLCSPTATAPRLAAFAPCLCNWDNLSLFLCLLLTVLCPGTRVITPKWALAFVMSMPPDCPFSSVIIFQCWSDVVAFPFNPLLPIALEIKTRILILFLLRDLSLTRLSSPISPHCSPCSGTSYLGLSSPCLHELLQDHLPVCVPGQLSLLPPFCLVSILDLVKCPLSLGSLSWMLQSRSPSLFLFHSWAFLSFSALICLQWMFTRVILWFLPVFPPRVNPVRAGPESVPFTIVSHRVWWTRDAQTMCWWDGLMNEYERGLMF